MRIITEAVKRVKNCLASKTSLGVFSLLGSYRVWDSEKKRSIKEAKKDVK